MCCGFLINICWIIGTLVISGMIYGLLRNPGEPCAMTDEEKHRECEHAQHPIRELVIYGIICLPIGIILRIGLFY